ncbi:MULTISPECIES: hypothetical protein [Aeromonas]|uniref:hypothetical protein n=1 Tax=Aeromonas TaxID=642 RepID=UPI0005A813F0|nr:hypothetical protein [Aeromonas caviae]MBS4637140.1 hypothetical protein [Aeromonas caviae]WQD87244.1 hypothetical protein U0022_10725 [Aeromonas caviae]SQH59696.1 Uncharacterised protein [Aeromonas caviae]
MLGIWLGVALVNISGYQPIAEQTWVQLNPEYYPVQRPVPPIFAAWRGNQFPPLEQRKKNGRWQILFPARLVPPFDLFEGEAQLSKAYLARLKRIDEMAYGMAPHQSVPHTASSAPSFEVPGAVAFVAEFSLPRDRKARMPLEEPLLARLGGQGVPTQALARQGDAQPMAATGSAPEPTTLTLSATAAGEASRVCHQVAAGETLWRIASQLQSKEAGGSDTYSYLLALVQENRDRMVKGIRVQAGLRLYCPTAQTLAQFDALSPAQRQQQFARLEQGR